MQSSQLLNEIASKREQFRLLGADMEATGRLSPTIVDWLYDMKLFKMMVPDDFGGRPTPMPERIRAFDELAYIDASIGWNVSVGSGGGLFIPSFSKHMARQLFSPREAVITGTGFPGGRARKVEGGYIVNGRWLYASGSQYASFFTANALCDENGEEKVRAFAFFRDEVRVLDEWRAFGLKATASNPWVVENLFVPDERMFVVGDVAWHVDDPNYRISFNMMAATGNAAVLFGIMRHFFDVAVELSRPAPAVDAQHVAAEVTHRRELFYSLADSWWLRLTCGESAEEKEEKTIITSIRRLVIDSITDVHQVFPYLRMRALWEGETINRIYRDLQTAGHHIGLRG